MNMPILVYMLTTIYLISIVYILDSFIQVILRLYMGLPSIEKYHTVNQCVCSWADGTLCPITLFYWIVFQFLECLNNKNQPYLFFYLSFLNITTLLPILRERDF